MSEMNFEEKIDVIALWKQKRHFVEFHYKKNPDKIQPIINQMNEYIKKYNDNWKKTNFDGDLRTIDQFVDELSNSIGETVGKPYVYGIYHENNMAEIINYCYFTHNKKFTKDEFEMMYNKARQACEDDWGTEYPSLANLWQKMYDIYGFDLYEPDVVLLYLEASDDEHIRVKVDEIYNKQANTIETIADKVVKDAIKYNEYRRDHVNDFILEYIMEVHDKILDVAMEKIKTENKNKEKEINDTIDQFFNEMSEKYNIKFDGFDINNLWKYDK